MELLRKIIFTATIICFTAFVSKAQTAEQMIKGFKDSYASEYKGDYNGAISNLQKVYRADSYECNLRMGWLQYSAKKYASAMDFYQKAIDLKKYSVEARIGYIAPANAAKQYDKAYQKYEEILKIDPYNSTANYWVGVAYYTLKNYQTAAKYFELLVNMLPFDYDSNHMLGWTYLSLGRAGEAKLMFEKALLNRPDDASAKDGLAKSK